MRTHLNNNELDVVKKVVQHNAHMAHPENILLCAIMNEDQDYRKIHFSEKYPSSFDELRSRKLFKSNLLDDNTNH